ncbi:MAG TPA: hypothetical protein HA222_04990 [Candidatus Diapherotrites archaeon]|uniref:Ferritin-like diiron domain-containing protein n=2 Tax=Candidatus Iainarchaeum sp. TaxID=3101447 RepID=A0A7J4JW36_9ARCH|nr:hypothetical protein [Candidatus Diapherotrites archaeon]HIH32623.1 hypothetical protein [Candidatus Diapherotrites archaeon]
MLRKKAKKECYNPEKKARRKVFMLLAISIQYIRRVILLGDNKPSKKIVEMIQAALTTEHQANIQYLSHAEIVDGFDSEPIIAKLKEIADDEKGHQAKLRELLGDYLGEVPTMEIAKTKKAGSVKEILETNLVDEKQAVKDYTAVMEQLKAEKAELPYAFLTAEHTIRHIIMDECEHIAELKKLLAVKP